MEFLSRVVVSFEGAVFGHCLIYGGGLRGECPHCCCYAVGCHSSSSVSVGVSVAVVAFV
ncbi:hypothetical protein GCM10023197_18150 [Gordonia humi]